MHLVHNVAHFEVDITGAIPTTGKELDRHCELYESCIIEEEAIVAECVAIDYHLEWFAASYKMIYA